MWTRLHNSTKIIASHLKILAKKLAPMYNGTRFRNSSHTSTHKFKEPKNVLALCTQLLINRGAVIQTKLLPFWYKQHLNQPQRNQPFIFGLALDL